MSDAVLSASNKSFPLAADGVPFDQISTQQWNLLQDFATPVCSLYESALKHNIRSIAAFCAQNRAELAPHAKTTMSPELIACQLDAGATAITAATLWQVRMLASWGVGDILLANEVTDTRSLTEIFQVLGDAELMVFVDSPENVAATAAGVPEGRQLPVLIELGAVHERSGVRDNETAIELARRVAAEPRLKLVGLATYEGVFAGGRRESALGRVRSLLQRTRELAQDLIAEEAFDPDWPVILTAGGSRYFDLICQELGTNRFEYGREVRLLLRSGCYLTHDDGDFAQQVPLIGTGPRSAIRIWSRVLSVPEPGWALIDAGKRDLTSDEPLGRVLAVHRDGHRQAASLKLTKLNDHHGYVQFSGDALRPGDICELGIAHACLTFNKWRVIPLVDDQLRVTSAVRTFF